MFWTENQKNQMLFHSFWSLASTGKCLDIHKGLDGISFFVDVQNDLEMKTIPLGRAPEFSHQKLAPVGMPWNMNQIGMCSGAAPRPRWCRQPPWACTKTKRKLPYASLVKTMCVHSEEHRCPYWKACVSLVKSMCFPSEGQVSPFSKACVLLLKRMCSVLGTMCFTSEKQSMCSPSEDHVLPWWEACAFLLKSMFP